MKKPGWKPANILVLGIFMILPVMSVHSQNVEEITDSDRLKMLNIPEGRVDVILDTDTYNEIDDQFAVVYALLSKEKLNVKAIYAAPFLNYRVSSPGEGMQQSYEEIFRVLETLNRSAEEFVFKGSNQFLENGETPVNSEAANHLVEYSKKYSREHPLYVMAVGAPTNIASALLIDPTIINRIVVIWLGGHGYEWPDPKEFNYRQDLFASRTLFNSGVPFVQIPCRPITTHLTTTIAEMNYYLAGKGETAEYLLKIFMEHRPERHVVGFSKVLWDMTAIAWVINSSWIPTEVVHSPIITDNYTYSFNMSRHLMRTAYFVDRDAILRDFFQKLSQ